MNNEKLYVNTMVLSLDIQSSILEQRYSEWLNTSSSNFTFFLACADMWGLGLHACVYLCVFLLFFVFSFFCSVRRIKSINVIFETHQSAVSSKYTYPILLYTDAVHLYSSLSTVVVNCMRIFERQKWTTNTTTNNNKIDVEERVFSLYLERELPKPMHE